MSLRRLKITSLFLALAALGNGPVEACWMTDWLYGRQASPYAAGYAPAYAPIAVAGYSAPGYAASYAPSYAPTTSAPVVTPVLSSGAYQVQRPAYSVNPSAYANPSVYTGQPVGTNVQTAYSVPLTTTPQILRGGALSPGLQRSALLGVGPTSSYLGAANVYPNSSYYSSGYGAAGYGAAGYGAARVAVPVGTPATALPATTVAPLFPNAPRPVARGGLARFFGSLFGTNYRSSYYRAPVTYYRPVTSVDPVLGTTVTVQQPCTSTIGQLQRTPYNSFQLGQPTPVGPSPLGIAPGCNTTPMYGQVAPAFAPSALGQGSLGASGIGQASAIGTAPGQFTVPIPSTMPAPQGYGPQSQGTQAYGQNGYQPSTAPLTGSPSSPRSQSDLEPVDQPSLRGYQRNETSYRNEPPAAREPQHRSRNQPQNQPDQPKSKTRQQESYWQLQDAEDSTAMIGPGQPRSAQPRSAQPRSAQPRSVQRYGAIRPQFEGRQTPQPPAFTGVEPIRALEDAEPSPFRRQLDKRSHHPSTEAAQLPVRSIRRSSYNAIPVREAALTRHSVPAPAPRPAPIPVKRDNTWSIAE